MALYDGVDVSRFCHPHPPNHLPFLIAHWISNPLSSVPQPEFKLHKTINIDYLMLSSQDLEHHYRIAYA